MADNIEVEVKLCDHIAGGKCWCGLLHSVPEAARLNGSPMTYDALIQRQSGQEDPLVQEPKS